MDEDMLKSIADVIYWIKQEAENCNAKDCDEVENSLRRIRDSAEVALKALANYIV